MLHSLPRGMPADVARHPHESMTYAPATMPVTMVMGMHFGASSQLPAYSDEHL